MRQRHGIAGLPAYQEGGLHVPQEDIPLVVPDTLMGAERARMMRILETLGADTTQVSQAGIHDYLNSPEYRDIMEFLHEVRGGDLPSVRTYADHWGTAGTYSPPFARKPPSKDEIALNILATFLPTHGRSAVKSGSDMTKARWEKEPRDVLRDTHLHEVHHALEYDPTGVPVTEFGEEGASFDPISQEDFESRRYNPWRYKKRGGVGTLRGEVTGLDRLSRHQHRSEDFEAVFKALQNAQPGDSKKDVLLEAAKLVWDLGSGGTERARIKGFQLHGRVLRPQEVSDHLYTGTGLYDDPVVFNPEFKEEVVGEQMGELLPHLDFILGTEKFADHPLNWDPARMDAERIQRGLESLRSPPPLVHPSRLAPWRRPSQAIRREPF